MADDKDKIDPALVQLARQDPGRVFLDRGYAVQHTSTCTDMPARWPVSREQEWTQRMYADIAVTYHGLDGSTLCRNRKEKIGYCCDLYNRSQRTIETALSLFPKST